MSQHDRSLPFGCGVPRRTGTERAGFTLVELLVVITIIGILVAMLMPAVQGAREAGRRATCANNLKQLGLGAINHETKVGHFPTGGWGWHWIGDPDRGFMKRQPGGWAYNILPYIEQEQLHQLGKDGRPDELTQTQKDGANIVAKTPLLMFNCPSRRRSIAFPSPNDGTFVAFNATNNPASDNVQARSDYAINSGSQQWNEYSQGPANLEGAESHNWGTREYTGVSYHRSEVQMAHVRDGASFTFLIGEKYLNPDHYETGADSSDNENMYTGFNNDNFRVTYRDYPPRQDRRGSSSTFRFGSAHSAGAHFVFCDGHVQRIPYSIDPLVFESGGHRSDGAGPKPEDGL